jgi:hypothetical protein
LPKTETPQLTLPPKPTKVSSMYSALAERVRGSPPHGCGGEGEAAPGNAPAQRAKNFVSRPWMGGAFHLRRDFNSTEIPEEAEQ